MGPSRPKTFVFSRPIQLLACSYSLRSAHRARSFIRDVRYRHLEAVSFRMMMLMQEGQNILEAQKLYCLFSSQKDWRSGQLC